MRGGGKVNRRGTPKERFLAVIEKVDGPLDTQCWIIPSSAKKYPSFWMGPGTPGKNKEAAHRCSYRIFVLDNEPIPDGVQILHNCDNQKCGNPDHIYPGTHKKNMEDKVNRGRMQDMSGTKNPRAILDEDLVADIKGLLRTGRLGLRELGRLYGVDHGTIRSIRDGRSWPDVKARGKE
jgi:hypothetical protein